MSDARTLVTELGTAIGILDRDPGRVWFDRPRRLRNVSDLEWLQLREAAEGADADRYAAAVANGRYFLLADDGLRGRPPALVEWRGPTRSPGDEVAPIDLRVDHVYQVSCKYLSRITLNASPAYLFERLAAGGQGRRAEDWFDTIDLDGHRRLYRSAVDACGGTQRWPGSLDELDIAGRKKLAAELKEARSDDYAEEWQRFSDAVSERSAQRWRHNLASSERASMLWRLLRIGSAPYFVLGLEGRPGRWEPLRVRVMTPWDWRHAFSLIRFEIEPGRRAQPSVDWRAFIEDRSTGGKRRVEGHVEVRWSHGRFVRRPEAKVYLDTPLSEVAGYVPL